MWKENAPFGTPAVNSGVAALDKRIIGKSIGQYVPGKRLFQNHGKEDVARVWPEKERALLDVRLGRIVALLNLYGAYDDKLWMSRSVGQFC